MGYTKSYKGVYGVGTNDATYPTQVNGKHCPYYLKWKTMLLRVTTKPYDCYNDTVVCDEWLYFTNFKKWMECQDWQGKHLDKDLLGDGSLYSPDTCCFISPHLNSFLTRKTKPTKFMEGVGKSYNRFFSRCTNPLTGSRYRVGTFNCEVAAHISYKLEKFKWAVELSKGLEEPIAEALVAKFRLGFGDAGALDFDLDSYTLRVVEGPKAPVVSKSSTNDIGF